MKFEKRLHGNCKGISSLEFVLVLPMLVFILLAAVELSRAWENFNVMVQAAREGARVGSVAVVVGGDFTAGKAAAIARIQAVLSDAGLADNLVMGPGKTDVTCAPCGSDNPVTARVVLNFPTLFPLGLVPNMQFTHTTVMRME